ncbi:MAG: hypothetical protein ACM3X7_07285 [Solirubrobacterales bacterium]
MICEQQDSYIKLGKMELTKVAIYSISHGLIDACCAAIIGANILLAGKNLTELTFSIVMYNIIAFALQTPVGLVVDKIKKPAESAALGCILVLIGLIFYKWFFVALIISGLGNAFFHVGGGVIILNLRPGKAALPGIYVAPGAIGLLIGTLIGKSVFFSPLFFSLLLIIAAASIVSFGISHFSYNNKVYPINFGRFDIVIICILSSVAIRGLVGSMLAYNWKVNLMLLAVFTVAVALGKGFGGILGDAFGWTRVTIGGLIISAPLLVLGIKVPILAIAGVFFFNLTMPITLVITSIMLPGKPGFAFGLTTLALIIGVFPTFTKLKPVLCSNNGALIMAAVLIMALLLWFGLKAFFSVKND